MHRGCSPARLPRSSSSSISVTGKAMSVRWQSPSRPPRRRLRDGSGRWVSIRSFARQPNFVEERRNHGCARCSRRRCFMHGSESASSRRRPPTIASRAANERYFMQRSAHQDRRMGFSISSPTLRIHGIRFSQVNMMRLRDSKFIRSSPAISSGRCATTPDATSYRDLPSLRYAHERTCSAVAFVQTACRIRSTPILERPKFV